MSIHQLHSQVGSHSKHGKSGCSNPCGKHGRCSLRRTQLLRPLTLGRRARGRSYNVQVSGRFRKQTFIDCAHGAPVTVDECLGTHLGTMRVGTVDTRMILDGLNFIIDSEEVSSWCWLKDGSSCSISVDTHNCHSVCFNETNGCYLFFYDVLYPGAITPQDHFTHERENLFILH